MPISSAYVTLNGLQIVLDPRKLEAEFENLNLDTSKFKDRANSFSLPRGKWPGRGYLLLQKKDYDALDLTAFHKVKFNAEPDNVEVERLLIVSAESLLGGNQDETDNDVLLVEFADARILANLSYIDRPYNLLAPDYSSYFLGTTVAGTPYDWPGIVSSLYSALPSVFTSFDVASANSHPGTPEGYAFQGMSAWDALSQVSDILDNLLYVDRTGKLWMISAADAHTNYTTTFNDHRGNLLYHGRNRTNNFVGMPANIRVLFPSRNHAFQNSVDPLDVCYNTYWQQTPHYGVNVATSTVLPDADTQTGTYVALFDSLEALYDITGVLTNGAALNTQAADRAADYLNALDIADQATHQIYSGAVDFTPGSKVSVVTWFDTGDGIKTEIILSSRKKFTPPKVFADSSLAHIREWSELVTSEFPGPPDTAREHKPYEHWAIAQIDNVSGITPFGSANAKVKYSVDGATYVESTKTIVVHDIYGYQYADNDVVFCQYHGQSRTWIIINPPTSGFFIFRFELTEDLDLGGSAAAEIVVFNGAAYVKSGIAITVKDFTSNPGSWKGKEGYQGWCVYAPRDSATFEIVWMETQARYVEFTLDAAISGGEAEATVDSWWDIKEPDSPITVVDRQGLFEGAPEGAQGLAIYDETTDEYVIVRVEHFARWIKFKMYSPWIGPPDTFEVEVQEFWEGLDPSDVDGRTEVMDRGEFFPDAKVIGDGYTTDAEGYACYDPEFGTYIVVQLEQVALELRGIQSGAIASGDAEGTVTSPFYVVGRSLYVQKPTDDITAKNIYGFAIDDGAEVLVGWDFDNKYWFYKQAECPA